MFGYSSLFTCLVQEFQYPEATAYRLLNAMKLVSEVPEVEGKIQSGKALCKHHCSSSELLPSTKKREWFRHKTGGEKTNNASSRRALKKGDRKTFSIFASKTTIASDERN